MASYKLPKEQRSLIFLPADPSRVVQAEGPTIEMRHLQSAGPGGVRELKEGTKGPQGCVRSARTPLGYSKDHRQSRPLVNPKGVLQGKA